ncbi:MAG TPA: ABC transporter substrate-binding protein [Bacillota bacterium]|nr:ABC transporter substrate-binding protein [Bacillota bacterium]
MGKNRWIGLNLIVLLFLVLFNGCGSANTVKIGTILPISGQVAAYGSQSRDAMQMAVDELNAAGGVLGKQIELLVEDDENNPEKTVNAFIKLTTKDKVIGLVGAMTSKCTLAITEDAQAKEVVLITPTSTNDTVTDAGNYIFRSCYNDSFQGQVVAQFAAETLKAKKAAILYDITNDYSKGLTTNFTNKFKELGGAVVAAESYSSGDKDFNAQLTKIKSATPDVLFIPDYYSTVSLVAKQVRGLGITVPMLGADGWDEITNNAGTEVLGCYYCNHYSPEAEDPEVKQFVAKFKEKYQVTPNALAALSYDAVTILVEAIRRAGSVEPAAIRAAMTQTDRKLITGKVTFNERNNPVKSAVILKIVKGTNGKLVTEYAGTVNPG